MQKWGYLAITRTWEKAELRRSEWVWDDDENDQRSVTERLNGLGQEGWESVCVVPVALEYGEGRAGKATLTYVLKRPLETAR